MIAKTDVLLVAPELSSISDLQWDFFIAYAYAQMSPNAWGDLLDFGARYLAAHLATVTSRRGNAGGVASESVGSVSRSFAAPSGSDLNSTSYGSEYQRLARTLLGARLPLMGGC